MTPVQASEKKNENKVYKNLYPDDDDRRNIQHKFKVGDKVRITKKKSIFEKGYTPRWTEEILCTRGTRTPHFLDWGVPYPPLFRTQVKNLLSSEAICGDQITL